ncbi:HlyC/CorC family transporter [Muricomes intestini]|uniref:CBS domain containing-hemolysin-like protein n=1 Tax=Muricomes intestini TaxID=1796634 RepID=A0A4R3K3X0_9FIRM|nr:hemolysin family protein [Muricomes intestini]TCS77403.1 CBS domain containing-hemolysin-like protein [Muricomes intestini]HAX50362.1 hemolysin [Lachnospiraceae bacterium]HCR81880.1 hemolysin [Lachnospiraceae bacterium]
MDSDDAIRFIILILLLMLSAFFSSAETALTTVNKIRMRSLAEEGNKRAQMVLDILDNHSRKILSAILIGNNVVNITASAVSATLAYDFGGYMVGIATAIITVAILVFGKIVPKNIAAANSEKRSLSCIRVIKVFMTLMTPFIFIINILSRGILFLFRIDPDTKNSTITEAELRTIVDEGHEDGVIESEEKEMIYNVFDLGDVYAKDVMVPRIHVTFADINSTYEELIAIFKEDKHTRLPIYEETTDNIIGIINMKDLLLFESKESFCVRDILREAYFTYEYKNVSELLVEMRSASFNIAIVLDEYGETAGLITLEDILEEIVGEIRDEYDAHEEEFVRQLGENEYIVEGSMSLDDVNERLDLESDLELESEDYDSLGGLIIEYLDRLPEVGDEVITENGIRLVVECLDKNRIESVHVYLPEDRTAVNIQNEEN